MTRPSEEEVRRGLLVLMSVCVLAFVAVCVTRFPSRCYMWEVIHCDGDRPGLFRCSVCAHPTQTWGLVWDEPVWVQDKP